MKSENEARRPSATARWSAGLLAVFAVRRGEGTRALLAGTYLFLIICSYLLIKAVRNAMFIAEFGAMKLPYVMLGIAVLAGMAAALYLRLARRVALDRLIVGSLLFFASNVLLFWWIALQGRTWLYPLLYLWAGVYGVIATTQVWTLANHLFTTREAKRLFGVVGAGGILGGVIGGWLTNLLAPRIGTANLLLVVCGLLVGAAGVVTVLCRVRKPAPRAKDALPVSMLRSFSLIWRSPMLRLLAALVFITAMATTSVDFQFSLVAEKFVSDRDQLAALFGFVYGTVALLSFVLQLLLTSRVLAHVGVGFSILLLPFALISSSVALLASGALWAGVFLKGSDGAFKHSLDRSCRELMYLPLPLRVKLQTKSTIDTVMDRMGDGSAGALQLFVTAGLGLGLRASLIANFFVIGIWILLGLRLKREYVRQLLEAVGRPRQSPFSMQPLEAEGDARRMVERLLSTGSEAEKLGALDWTALHDLKVDEAALVERARSDDSPAVRRRALSLLLGGGEGRLPPEWVAGLEQEGQALLVDAIDLMLEEDPDRARERLETLLGEEADATIRLSLVAFLLRRLGPEFEPFATRVFEALLAARSSVEGRCAAVRALAMLPADCSLHGRLPGLLRDPSLEVVRCAAETIGRVPRPDLLAHVIALLDHPDVRVVARRAVRAHGEEAIPPLTDALDDREVSPQLRRQIPRLLAQHCTSASIDSLVVGLNDEDRIVRRRCLDALYRLRHRYPNLRPLRGAGIVREVLRAMEEYGELASTIRSFADGEETSPTVDWLRRVLVEEQARILRRVFLLLGLEYDPGEMHRAWLTFRDGQTVERANALELLDNLLPKALKRHMLPLLEDGVAPDFGRRVLTAQQALRTLMESRTPWVVASALYAARTVGVDGLEEEARRTRESGEPLIREEARAYLEWAGAGASR